MTTTTTTTIVCAHHMTLLEFRSQLRAPTVLVDHRRQQQLT